MAVSPAATSATPRARGPRDETLAAILRLARPRRAPPGAPLVVGCQEMPKWRACGHLRALAARPLSGRAGRAAIGSATGR